MSPDLPPGYEVFELEWRGCWHFRGPDTRDNGSCADTRAEAVRQAWEAHRLASLAACPPPS